MDHLQTTRATESVTTLSTGDLRALGVLIADLPAGATPEEIVDQLDALERLKCAAAAAQATATVALSRRRHAAASAAADTAGRRLNARARSGVDLGLGAEVAMARHESPHAGRRHVRLAHGLTQMPQTRALLAAGDLSERRAEIMVAETEDLTADDRRLVDDAARDLFLGLGDQDLTEKVRELVLAIDDRPMIERHRKALANRHVRTRTVGNGMSRISAMVPSERVKGMLDSLEAEATALKQRTPSDERTQAQRVVDILVARLSGTPEGEPMPVATKLVLSVTSLLGDDDTPGRLDGAGAIPARVARDLIRRSLNHASATIQRLFAHPVSGALIAAERTQRGFPAELADLIRTRDADRCRTPWCNAQVRHIDHPTPVSAGGITSLTNGQGLCAACNYAKEQPGWSHRPRDGHVVELVTPTGHCYTSREPGLPVPRVRLRPGLDLVLSGRYPRSA